MSEVVLTCIIPVSQVNPYFGRLSSLILNLNRFKQIQTILVHDVHDSESSILIDSLLHKLPKDRLTFLEGTFGSPGEARNSALELVATPWVIFTDGDDSIFPDKYLQILHAAIESAADIAIAGIKVTDFVDTSRTSTHLINPLLSIQENLSLMPAFTRVLYRTNFIKGLRFPNFLMAEDQCFLFSVLQRKPKFFVSDEIVYEYFVGRPSQLTSKSSPAILDLRKSIECILQPFGKLDKELIETGYIFLFRLVATLIRRLGFSSLPILYQLAPRILYVSIAHPSYFLHSLKKFLLFRKALISA